MVAVYAYLGEIHAFKFWRKLPAKSMKLCTLYFALLTLYYGIVFFAHNFQVSHFQCESAWAIHSLLRMANVWNVSFRAYIIIQLIKAHYLIIPPLPPTNASPQFLQKLASYIHLADVVPFWLFIVIIPLVLI